MPGSELATKLIGAHGERGAAWVAAFPATLRSICGRWSLRPGERYPYVGYAWVARVTLADGSPAVLKLAPPSDETTCEIDALRIYGGRGAVRLLDADPAVAALLLERLEPGTPLAELEDDERATRIAAGVMRETWRPLPQEHGFPTLERRGAALGRFRAARGEDTSPFPPGLFAAAEATYARLCASAAPPVLLHGDLHHWNILSAERQPWLAIDPKGLAGEPAFEAGALLRNRIGPLPAARQRAEARATILAAELGLDRRRILDWAFAQAVLSVTWSLEDEGALDSHAREVLALAAALLDS